MVEVNKFFQTTEIMVESDCVLTITSESRQIATFSAKINFDRLLSLKITLKTSILSIKEEIQSYFKMITTFFVLWRY